MDTFLQAYVVASRCLLAVWVAGVSWQLLHPVLVLT